MSGPNCRELNSSDDGLPTSDTNCSFDSPVESVFRSASLFATRSVQKTDKLDLQRLLLQNSNNPPALKSYSGSSEGFTLLQQSTDPLYYQRPLAERLDVAFWAVALGLGSGSALLRTALGESGTLPQAVSLVDPFRRTILHVVASTLARGTRMSIRYSETHGCSELEAQERESVEGRNSTKTLENELLLTSCRLESLPKGTTCAETKPALYNIWSANAVLDPYLEQPQPW